MKINEALDFLITDTLFYGFSAQLNTDNRLKLLLKFKEALNNEELLTEDELKDLTNFINEYELENETIMSSYDNSYKQSILSKYPQIAIKLVKDYLLCTLLEK